MLGRLTLLALLLVAATTARAAADDAAVGTVFHNRFRSMR